MSDVNPMKPISITGSAVTLDRKNHGGGTVLLNRAAGMTVTLPYAVGSGDEYDIVVGTTFTSNGIIKVGRSADTFVGCIGLSTDVGGTNCLAGGTDDTLTMNGSTTGGLIGSRVRLKDIGNNKWLISGDLVTTGTEGTPFSATV